MIKAIFDNEINAVTVPGLIQWDYGQKLLILGLSLPDVAEVHFASDTLYSEAITRFAKKDADSGGYVVDIPNEVLRVPHDVKAWVYLIDETQGKTLKTILMPLFKRSRPKDFVNPPDTAEETLLNEMIAHFNETAETMRLNNEDFKTGMTEQNEAFKNDVNKILAERAEVIHVMDENSYIEVPDRIKGHLYFNTTKRESGMTDGSISVSPNMRLKVIKQ